MAKSLLDRTCTDCMHTIVYLLQPGVASPRQKKALGLRFNPLSMKSQYQAVLQLPKKDENWADYADDVRLIADKAYPELED